MYNKCLLVLWRGVMVMWKVERDVKGCDSCQYIGDDLTSIVSVSLRKYDIFS